MVDKYDVISNTANMWPVQCPRAILQVRIGEMPNQGRNFGSHAVLGTESSMGIPLEHQSLKQGPVEVIAVSFLYSQ